MYLYIYIFIYLYIYIYIFVSIYIYIIIIIIYIYIIQITICAIWDNKSHGWPQLPVDQAVYHDGSKEDDPGGFVQQADGNCWFDVTYVG